MESIISVCVCACVRVRARACVCVGVRGARGARGARGVRGVRVSCYRPFTFCLTTGRCQGHLAWLVFLQRRCDGSPGAKICVTEEISHVTRIVQERCNTHLYCWWMFFLVILSIISAINDMSRSVIMNPG